MKKTTKVFLTILFIILFIVCFSPELLIWLVKGSITEELRSIYWERRMQAMALFIGVGLIFNGIVIMVQKQVSWKSRSLWKQKGQFQLKEAEAFRNGLLRLIIGIGVTIWSIPFWIKHVLRVIICN